MSAAAATGATAGLFVYAIALIDGSAWQRTTQIQVQNAATFLSLAVFFGAIIGALPGIFVMRLSRAKSAPWRSLPILCLGTTLGFIIAYAIVYSWGPRALFNSYIEAFAYALATVLPTAGGIVATRFVRPRGRAA